MSVHRDRGIEAFQIAVGMDLPIEDEAKILRQIQARAHELTLVIVCELSGIRDGDGRWSASDPVTGYLHDLQGLHQELNAARAPAPAPEWADMAGEPLPF